MKICGFHVRTCTISTRASPLDFRPPAFLLLDFDRLSLSSCLCPTGGGGDPYSLAAPGAEPLKLSHGTTTVAVVCEGGVIAAVDSRASMGSFVGSRTTQKVYTVHDTR